MVIAITQSLYVVRVFQNVLRLARLMRRHPNVSIVQIDEVLIALRSLQYGSTKDVAKFLNFVTVITITSVIYIART
jgi:hypothetical protein